MLAHPQPFESDKSDQPHQVIWENFVGYAVLADCQKLRAIENLYGLPRLPIFTDHSVDFDQLRRDPLPPPANRSGAFELRLQAADFRKHRDEACRIIRELLMDNPHSTLRIVLEPMSDPASLTMSFLQAIRTACLQDPSYLDRFYSMQLGRPKGAKHIVIRLPWSARDQAGLDWIDDVGQFASIVWTGENIPSEEGLTKELEAHEFVLV